MFNIMPDNKEIMDLAKEVLLQVRKARLTPEEREDVNRIIEIKHTYWWGNDLNFYDVVADVFTEKDFSTNWNGYPGATSREEQCKTAEAVNTPMCTSHMGHNPLVWLMNPTTARGIFWFNDHHVYRDNGEQVEGFAMYVDDFLKCDDGNWRIQKLRLAYRKQEGSVRMGAQ